ncbi:unnamed protein product [Brachionus calyciflorus]|uniref:Uncharacterized protein n=1 Tax=Brachionus calyciflorus TaxID=104777 RepID=A0A814FF22_9BILA|nr:unnamed protein product [Brachionus calyciflorus]
MYKLEKTDLVYDDKFSFVAKDNVWKVHVDKEHQSAKQWPDKWGYIIENDKNNSKQAKQSMTEPIKRINNFMPVPRTASAWIGWKSTEETCKLEKYGPYTKARGSIIKSLKWPSEAVS